MASGKSSGGPSWLGGSSAPTHGSSGPSWITGGGGSQAAAPAGRGGGHGFGHWLASKAELAAHDIKAMPGGFVAGAMAVEKDELHGLRHGDVNPVTAVVFGKHTKPLEKGVVTSSVEALRHPGRDPFNTALTVLPIVSGGASAVARGAAAADVAKGGGSLADIAKAASKKPEMPQRLIQVGDTKVPLHASQQPLPRAAQALHDRIVQRAIDKNPEGRVASYGTKRVGGSIDETARYQHRMRDVPSQLLQAAAKRLAPAGGRLPGSTAGKFQRVEQAALELTSVNTTAKAAAAYHAAQAEEQAARLAELKGKDVLKPGEQKTVGELSKSVPLNRGLSKLYEAVDKRGLLKTNESGDVIVDESVHPKLALADARLADVQGRGDEILARYGVRSAEQLAQRVNDPGRIRAGATYEKPTPAKAGVVSQAELKAQARVDRLQKLHDRAKAQVKEADAHYRGQHTAPDAESGVPLHDLAAGDVYPSDIYDAKTQVQYYGTGDHALDSRTFSLINRLRNKPDANVTIYRALPKHLGTEDQIAEYEKMKAAYMKRGTVPSGVDTKGAPFYDWVSNEIDRLKAGPKSESTHVINPGDWVTPSKEYAKMHAAGEKGWHVVSKRVPARELYTNGDSIHEFGWHPDPKIPHTPPRAERLGGALSVAKDDLERIKAAAAKRVKETGIVGGESARPGRGFVSYATSEPKAPKSSASASSSSVVGEAKAPVTSHAFTGQGIEHGHVPNNITGQAARHYHQIIRFVNTTEHRNLAVKTGADARRTSRDVLVKIPGAEHAKIPDVVNEILGKKTVTADDVEGLNAALHAYKEDIVPGLRDRFAADRHQGIGTPAPDGYKWVDRNVLGDLGRPAAGPRGKIARTADSINSAVTAATVYFKIGHIGTRVVTNAVTNVIQGSAGPRQIAKSVKLWDGISHEDKLRALAAAGQHGFEAMPHEGQSLAGRAATKGANWWAKHADAPFRFNSIAYEARKAGFDTPAKFHDMLDRLERPQDFNMNAAEHAKIDWVAKRSNRAQIAYDRMSDAERRFVTRAVWFYPWVKGASMFLGHTIAEHPYKTGALAAAGQQGKRIQENELGDLPSYEGGLIPLGGGRVMDLSTFSPFSTPADVMDAGARPAELSGFLNPAYTAGTNLIFGLNQYGQKSKSPLKDALTSVASPTPEAQIISAYLGRNQDQSNRMFPKSPALAGTKDPLIRALLGPWVPRKFNANAAHSSAARERSGR